MPLPLGDIARGIEAAKSSTFNLCQALEEGAMIVRANGGYLLGRRTVELGGAYIAQFNQMREFYTFCAEAELLRHEVVQIAMLHGTEAVYLARHEGRAPMRLTASIGSRFPAAPTAVGNALLTTLTDTEIAARFSGPQHFPRADRAERPDADRAAGQDPGRAGTWLRHRRQRGAPRHLRRRAGVAAVVERGPAAGHRHLADGGHATEDFVSSIVAELRSAVEHLSNPLVRRPID